MSVSSPKGFVSGGIAVGLKSSGQRDLALVVNQGPSNAVAVVFTSNRAQANPVLWSKNIVSNGTASAVILNSGGANCFTGSYGFDTTRLTAETVASQLDIIAEDVIVCSTGLIGYGGEEFRERIISGIPNLISALRHSDATAAEAILTTDSVTKTASHQGEGWSIGAMAKGAGMLAPSLATMLVVITTDAYLASNELDVSLRVATSRTFDRLDSDGCTSTNDQVTLMASGASGVKPDLDEFTTALSDVCDSLAAQMQADAEGASHTINIEVIRARDESDAVEVGRAVARNNLFKTAVFGNDPNWGRVLAAIGTTRAHFDPYNVDVSMNGVRVCHQGAPDRPSSDVDLTPRDVHVVIDLAVGNATATVRTNDLTTDYVHENSAYSS